MLRRILPMFVLLAISATTAQAAGFRGIPFGISRPQAEKKLARTYLPESITNYDDHITVADTMGNRPVLFILWFSGNQKFDEYSIISRRYWSIKEFQRGLMDDIQFLKKVLTLKYGNPECQLPTIHDLTPAGGSFAVCRWNNPALFISIYVEMYKFKYSANAMVFDMAFMKADQK